MTVSAFDIDYDQFPKEFLLDFFRNDYENIPDYDIPEYMQKEQPQLGAGETVVRGFKVDCHNYFDEELRPIGEAFCKHFGITNTFITHYLCIEPHTNVNWHIDGGNVACALNFALEGEECAIEFEDGSHSYTLALLDVSKIHKVNNTTDKQRILFRLSFMDGTYEDIKRKCQKQDINE